MSTILIEGFDDYGPVNSQNSLVEAFLNAGEWTYGSIYTGVDIIASLNGQAGYALTMLPNGAGDCEILKDLPANYSRIIGGFRVSSQIIAKTGFVLYDGSTAQCSITIAPTTGYIAIQEGSNGTTLQVGSAAISANTVHFLEFDITFGTSSAGGWTVWLDGVQILHGTGTTQQSSNAQTNVVSFVNYSDHVGNFSFDDLYLFSSSGSINNSALLSNPIVYTQFPIGDHQTQFTNEGNVVGNYYSSDQNGLTMGSNSLTLIAITPLVACTVNDIVFVVNYASGSGSGNMKGVIYASSGGAPTTLLSSGSNVNGFTPGETITLPLTSPQALSANTEYFIGFINDTAMSVQYLDGTTQGAGIASNTFSSGAPSTAPSMTFTNPTIIIYASCTGASTNYESVAINPSIGDVSSIASASTGVTDLYVFANLPTSVQAAYAVSVRGKAKLSAAGTHTINLPTKSGSTTSNGNTSGIAPNLSYQCYESIFDTDPNTSAAWTITGVNNSYSGVEVAS